MRTEEHAAAAEMMMMMERETDVHCCRRSGPDEQEGGAALPLPHCCSSGCCDEEDRAAPTPQLRYSAALPTAWRPAFRHRRRPPRAVRRLRPRPQRPSVVRRRVALRVPSPTPCRRGLLVAPVVPPLLACPSPAPPARRDELRPLVAGVAVAVPDRLEPVRLAPLAPGPAPALRVVDRVRRERRDDQRPCNARDGSRGLSAPPSSQSVWASVSGARQARLGRGRGPPATAVGTLGFSPTTA